MEYMDLLPPASFSRARLARPIVYQQMLHFFDVILYIRLRNLCYYNKKPFIERQKKTISTQVTSTRMF